MATPGDINIVIAANSGNTVQVLNKVEQSVKRVGKQVNTSSRALKANQKQYNSSAVATNKFAKGAMQQAGYQFADFAVQVQNGTSKMQAFGQQGSQMLAVFGPWGAVAGAAVAIGSALWTVWDKSRLSAKGLKKDIEALTEAFDLYAAAADAANLSTEDIVETYGIMTQELQSALDVLRDLAKASAMDVLQEKIDKLWGSTGMADYADAQDRIAEKIREMTKLQDLYNKAVEEGKYRYVSHFPDQIARMQVGIALLEIDLLGEWVAGIEDMGGKLGLTADQAQILAEKMREAADAGNVDDQVKALGEAQILFSGMVGDTTDNTEAQKLFAEALAATLVEAAKFQNEQKVAAEDLRRLQQSYLVEGMQGYKDQIMLVAERQKAEAIAAAEAEAGFKRAIIAAYNLYATVRAAAAAAGVELSQAGAAIVSGLRKNIAGQQFTASLVGLSDAAKDLATQTRMVNLEFDELVNRAAIENPAVVHSLEMQRSAALALVYQLNAGRISAGDFDKAIIDLSETGISGFTEMAEPLTALQERTKSIADTIQSSMTDAFMSMVDGTKTVADSFKDMARLIIKKLYEVLVVQQLVGSWDAQTGQGSGWVGTIMTAVTGARAMGGPVTGGNAYLVGERGPEMIVPSRNSHVVPNNSLGGGGITVNQTINVSTGVQQTVRTEVMQLMPQIANAAKGAVLDAKRRGGSFASAF